MARTAAARNRHGLERCTAGQRPPAVSGAKAWPYPHRTRRAHFEGYTYVPKGYMSRARKADAFSSDEEDRAAAALRDHCAALLTLFMHFSPARHAAGCGSMRWRAKASVSA